MQPGLHSPDWLPHDAGDVLVRRRLLVKQEEYTHVFRSQLPNRRFDLPTKLIGLLDNRSLRLVSGVSAESRPLRPAREPGPTAIDGNTHDPGLECPVRVPALETAKDAEKDFLGNVFGIVLVLQDPEAQTKDVALKARHQRLDRARVTAQAPLYQDCLGQDHVQANSLPYMIGYLAGRFQVSFGPKRIAFYLAPALWGFNSRSRPITLLLGCLIENLDDFIGLGLLKHLAAAVQFLGETNRRVLHALVRVLGAPDQNKMLATRDALVLIIVVEANAHEADDFPFTGLLLLFGHAMPLWLIHGMMSTKNYTLAETSPSTLKGIISRPMQAHPAHFN